MIADSEKGKLYIETHTNSKSMDSKVIHIAILANSLVFSGSVMETGMQKGHVLCKHCPEMDGSVVLGGVPRRFRGLSGARLKSSRFMIQKVGKYAYS